MKKSFLKKSLVWWFVLLVWMGLTKLAGTGLVQAAQEEPPNIVVIFVDDMGWGDLSCYGHPTIRTPNLDRMAAEGMRFTQFYAAACVCTPSRAALLTGRLPVRSGMCSDRRRVLFPDSGGGLPQSEVTLAEALKKCGYKTACIGKWHLGHLPQFLPTRNGFDYYFGLPYSNDMDRVPGAPKNAVHEPKIEYFNVPLMRNEKIIERPADQNTLTKRYTEETIQFIKQHQKERFFVYLAHNMPHVPLFRSKLFVGHSLRGVYGDAVEEIDWGVGRILQTLRELNLDRKTIVWFTSDNGPWLIQRLDGGSAGLLRGGKGSTWEGGMREPGIVWWPGHVPAGVVTAGLGCTMDIFTTSIKLAGGQVPNDRVIDGVDLRPLILHHEPSPRKEMFYYRGTRLFAVRQGPWKAHFLTQPGYGRKRPIVHKRPLLFHLEHDPSEKFDLSSLYPDVVARLKKLAEDHQKSVHAPPSQLDIILPKRSE